MGTKSYSSDSTGSSSLPSFSDPSSSSPTKSSGSAKSKTPSDSNGSGSNKKSSSDPYGSGSGQKSSSGHSGSGSAKKSSSDSKGSGSVKQSSSDSKGSGSVKKSSSDPSGSSEKNASPSDPSGSTNASSYPTGSSEYATPSDPSGSTTKSSEEYPSTDSKSRYSKRDSYYSSSSSTWTEPSDPSSEPRPKFVQRPLPPIPAHIHRDKPSFEAPIISRVPQQHCQIPQPTEFCLCGQNETEAIKYLPQLPNVTYCSAPGGQCGQGQGQQGQNCCSGKQPPLPPPDCSAFGRQCGQGQSQQGQDQRFCSGKPPPLPPTDYCLCKHNESEAVKFLPPSVTYCAKDQCGRDSFNKPEPCCGRTPISLYADQPQSSVCPQPIYLDQPPPPLPPRQSSYNPKSTKYARKYPESSSKSSCDPLNSSCELSQSTSYDHDYSGSTSYDYTGSSYEYTYSKSSSSREKIKKPKCSCCQKRYNKDLKPNCCCKLINNSKPICKEPNQKRCRNSTPSKGHQRVQNCLNQIRERMFIPPGNPNADKRRKSILKKSKKICQKICASPSPRRNKNIRRQSPEDWNRPWRRSKGQSSRSKLNCSPSPKRKASQPRQRERSPPLKIMNKNDCRTSVETPRHCRFSEEVEECPISIDSCCLLKKDEDNCCKNNTEKNACCCEEDPEEEDLEDDSKSSSDIDVDGSCCCDHGIPFSCCSPPTPPQPCPPCPPQKVEQRPTTVIVNNTDLCECESKWAKVERWKEAARCREEERRFAEIERERREERRRCKDRKERDRRYRESVQKQKEADERRREEAAGWRDEQRYRDAERLKFEEEKWIEELCDRQEERKFIEEQERRREERKFREEQLRERSTEGMAVPELEEMRRALAPVPQGPHEVFEYFCVEPRESSAERKKKADAQAIALMGMCKSHGIHLNLTDSAPKKTTVVLRMGPTSVGNKMLNIISGDPDLQNSGGGCCDNSASSAVPQDIQNIMMNVKQMTSPLLRFNQTTPCWTSMQANLGFPQGLGNTLAPYYTNNYFRNC